MMIARTSARSTSSIASGIARSIAWLIALRFSGRLSAMYASSPSIRTLIPLSAMFDTFWLLKSLSRGSSRERLRLQQDLHYVVFASVEDFVAFGGVVQRHYVADQGARIEGAVLDQARQLGDVGVDVREADSESQIVAEGVADWEVE